MKTRQPATRFTRIGTDVLKQLRAHCRATQAIQSEVVSRAVTAYLRRAGLSSGRSKTSTPNPSAKQKLTSRRKK